ncbi:MAG: cobyrinate a,c-diamide synthase [Alphaproteobacteria bacterium]|nr:cobyrinate a,c-diamide synthase [Alphaproteobacteria bacterium]
MPEDQSVPVLLLAAPASGSGKTTLTLALLRHFRDRGLAISSFKVGPDYIDPAFHAAASGRPCHNLDAWSMRPETMTSILTEVTADADLVLGEGVMGLFDGANDGSGSTADLAVALGIPVILVVDVRAQAGSAAAVVHGFTSYRQDLSVAGVVFNRVGGPGHIKALERACRNLPVPILGYLPSLPELALPDRHLGLVQAAEHADLEAFLDRAAGEVAKHLDLDRLQTLRGGLARPEATDRRPLPPLGQRIAVARDAAFAFCYPHLLADWRAAGAEILPFSPLADQPPDAAADAVYLPGGYPELQAGRLAGNRHFIDGLRAAAARQAAIHGECGGYMVLGEGLIDGAGERHAMAALLPLETSFAERRLHLGYRHMKLLADGPLGPAGREFRGHEFHYAKVLREAPGNELFEVGDALGERLGRVGLRQGRIAGSFQHLIDLV